MKTTKNMSSGSRLSFTIYGEMTGVVMLHPGKDAHSFMVVVSSVGMFTRRTERDCPIRWK